MVQEFAITAAGIFPFYFGFLWIFHHEYQESFLKFLRLFLLAGLTTVPFFGLQFAGIDQAMLSSLFGPLFALILLAFAEEVVKSVALFFDLHLKRHLYYPVLIGLGFAFFENVSYLFGLEVTSSFLIIAGVRLFMGSTAHAVFTALLAHVMNKAHHHSKTLYYLVGLFFAGSFHSFFNLLHHWEMSYLAVPLLILLIVYLHFDSPASLPQPHRVQAFSEKFFPVHHPLHV